MNKYLILDIDGVLNIEHIRHPNGRHGISWRLAERFNRIVEATNPQIVVSSSWRYEVLTGQMTLRGFEKMLARFGVDCEGRLIGVTEPDHRAGSRGELINMWLNRNAIKPYRYVVLDDGSYWLPNYSDHGMNDAGHSNNFVHTDGCIGLTDNNVNRAIRILGRTKRSEVKL